jgi:hypothetical protein
LFEKLIAETKARTETIKSANRHGVARVRVTEKGVQVDETVQIADATAGPSSTLGPSSVLGINTGGDNTTDGAKKSFRFKPNSVRVSSLKRGTWIEFLQISGEKIRAKLSWVSPLKGVFLFTSPGAKEALSIAPDELKRQLRQGEARVIEESSLIDRAVDRMVSSFSKPTT